MIGGAVRVALPVLLLLVAWRAPAQSFPNGWRLLAEGGQSFAPPSQRFAEFAAVAVARDLPLVSNLGVTVELFPALRVNETQLDHATREPVWAAAAAALLTYTVDLGRSGWGLRFDAGSGLFYGLQRIPAAGSRFNFLDQGGGFLTYRLPAGRRLMAGYRYVHVSNFGLVGGNRNPGLTFHALALAVD